ncbi:MAG: DUF2461 domain-containing protein [Bacteroidales bacterium]|jgi:uncharacterized protein (TIGR02453 family)|nr:DUF2461 domain-containing protein [Bacteroidales bacterium]
MKKNVFDFLERLKENNDRQWFQQHKTLYEEAKIEVESFVTTVIPGIAKYDPAVRFVEAKDCMFRIFRDIRFSKDKSPYKINMGAWITPSGRKSFGPGYYIHLQPDESFLSAGVYMPEPDALKKIRKEIYYNVAEFQTILDDKKLKKYFQGLDKIDKAKLAPKDFPKDFPEIDLLKNKHFILSYPLSQASIYKEDFNELVLKVFQTIQPFNRFLRRALED